MKKHLMRIVNANLFSKFIKTTVVVFMLTVAAGANAQVTPASITDGNGGSGKVVVTHVASGTESLFFDVKVDNAEGEKFTVIVKDDLGTTLYRSTFNNKDFKKRFVLPKTDASKLTFHIKSESGIKSETFNINTNTRVVEEVVVTKVI